MATADIDRTRVRALNEAAARPSGRYILYWMQQAARAECNHALELAVQLANEERKPLVVSFGLFEKYPEANARHFAFLLEGLAGTARALERRGIALVVRRGRPERVAADLARDASLVVCDRGYLRHQAEWRRQVAERAGCHVVEVETDVVVPVEVASNKPAYAARTLRPNLHRLWPSYLVELRTTALERDSLSPRLDGIDVSEPADVLASLGVDRSVAPVSAVFRGGTAQAKARLQHFLSGHIAAYSENGKRPETDDISTLGPYLHFGHVSPLAVALAVQQKWGAPRAEVEAFLEQLLVRRELAINYCRFTKRYDSYVALPEWAQATLAKHARDQRPHAYTKAQLEAAKTHDRYWNAAMREMKATGYLHNYMRMYWGKKILEWSASPQQAFRTTLALNNRYFLDGRDPNSYANVAWVFGLHDRPWKERAIFGTVRYMAASGLERKCDVEAYLARAEERVAAAEKSSR